MESKGFKSLKIGLASPEQILEWSYGEVTKPETINYRRLRPEKDGLFCEAIFGPTKDWQCYCGKYKNIRYKGIVCDKCGVEITRASVRRERMGHIELAAPVAHVWYTRRVPSHLGLLLNISRRNLDRVLYFAQYIVTHVDEDARTRAIKRLEEESAEAELVLNEEFAARKEGVKATVAGELLALGTQVDDVNEQYDKQVDEFTETIVKAAQSLERQIETSMGVVIESGLIFEPTGEVLAQPGEKVGREHLVAVQEASRSCLSEGQGEIEAKRTLEVQALEDRISQIKEAVQQQMDEIDEELGVEIDQLYGNAQVDREDLLSIKQIEFLGEARYRQLKSKWGQVFKAGMGAEAFFEILSSMNLDQMAEDLWVEIRTTRSKQRRKKATKRLQVVDSLRKSGNRPEWMILTVLPVIPPDLRPMVQLDGGRFATSDLNDLYRRVINRNNRLKRLLELGAPDVIVRNEKRMLQEAVDSLIDNSQRGKALSRRGRRELKSLSDMLKGKKGRFRRNLLGKRVDYSGRSVIVIGPNLKLHQCGLPKTMALELYRPFVISKLVHYGYASNVKGAKRSIEREKPEVWEVLAEVIKERPVLLNRAPTLHRLGIQAFEPVLVEGKAIHIHPLVCAAFNADFDGDQMAVHVPLSKRAVQEARILMLSSRNLLKPADGSPIVTPSKDMVLGIYYMTALAGEDERKGHGMVFSDFDEVELAYNLKKVDIHARIKIMAETYFDKDNQRYADGKKRRRLIETSPGRVMFNRVLPPEMQFYNTPLNKGDLQRLVSEVLNQVGSERTTVVVDRIKDIGFRFATRSGTTIAVSDLVVPKTKYEILDETTTKVSEVDRQFRRGLLTEEEQYSRTIELWTRAKDQVEDAVRDAMDPYGSVAMMALSGATKGGFGPITQLAGMRGLIADPSGRIITLPIRSNFREGLSALEYFISTHGARKGLADTALRTADAGYLTRRLVDVAQDIIVTGQDCGTHQGIWVDKVDNVGNQTLSERILGRFPAGPVTDPETGEILAEPESMITEKQAEKIEKCGITEVYVRSPMTCEMPRGLCAHCYGMDLGRGALVKIGVAIGIIAAQSIGEPGTQLTLRTFHTGGTAEARGDITHGLPRVEELFEARRRPKGEAVLTEVDGICEIRKVEGIRVVRVTDSEVKEKRFEIPLEWGIQVEDGQQVDEGDLIANFGEDQILAPQDGRISREDNVVTVLWEEKDVREYEIPAGSRLLVVEGQRVTGGESLTEGAKNPHHILSILGRQATRQYLLQEVQKVYRFQGVPIHDKHFEAIIRKMLNKVQIVDSGDSLLLPGDTVERFEFEQVNEEIREQGGRLARAMPVLLGITKAALTTESFLSAASFQHTIKVLAQAAIAGKEDELIGLKENVIIGKLIPAGTGFDYRIGEGEGELMFADEEEPDALDLEAEAIRRMGLDEISLAV
ncbi:MAG: DNA-directed RNA polymerase subunit beta' [Anaerolineales bacterium]|nr:DNA-directed RNA polymerase subunit beta' [Anaerolineales bacterium]